MRVQYDNRIKVVGVGALPWSRLGLEQWFTDYKIVSRYGWGTDDLIDAPPLFSLDERILSTSNTKLSSVQMLTNPDLHRYLIDDLRGCQVLTYRTMQPPVALTQAGCHLLGVDTQLVGNLENKAAFRELLKNEYLPFPRYRILERETITVDKAGLTTVLDGRAAVIIQDERLSGGQGTFLVRSLADLTRTLEQLAASSRSGQIVVSDYISDAFERTVQVCVTRYGIFVGPLQKQIIGHPLLSNLKAIGTGRYCGGEIGGNDVCQGAWDEIKSIATKVGMTAQAMGYRGIFGMDCLIDKRGRVYLLEMNPRMVGITPLLTMRYREGKDIPFLLLHVLELANVDYTITDHYIEPKTAQGGFMVCHAWSEKPTHLTSRPKAGLYDMVQKQRIKPNVHFDAENDNAQLLVQPATFDEGRVIKPGARMTTLMTNRHILDEQDQLTASAEAAVKWLQSQTVLEDV